MSASNVTLIIIGKVNLGPPIASVVGFIFGALITAWYTTKLKRGRNWMRLLLTIITVLSFVSLPFTIFVSKQLYVAAFTERPVVVTTVVTVTSVHYVLTAIAIVLINTRAARAWFHSTKDRCIGAA